MSLLDRLTEEATRRISSETSRRSLLGLVGAALVGGVVYPLLPVARKSNNADVDNGTASDAPPLTSVNDPQSCDYWRYCAIDGWLCSCCGGSHKSCPPGTVPSPVTWVGTCLNPNDGKSYIISYNDCCGVQGCGRCSCHRNEGERPQYRPSLSNDINWCLGGEQLAYNCSTAVLIGEA